MKYLKYVAVMLGCAAVAFTACASKLKDNSKETKTMDNMKSVIIYFTHSDNTELAARNLAGVTGGGRLVRLKPEKAYSSEDVDWENEQSRCTQEHLNQSLRPAIKPFIRKSDVGGRRDPS